MKHTNKAQKSGRTKDVETRKHRQNTVKLCERYVCALSHFLKGIFFRIFRALVSLFAPLNGVPVEITANIYHDKMIVQLNLVSSFFGVWERFVVDAARFFFASIASHLYREHISLFSHFKCLSFNRITTLGFTFNPNITTRAQNSTKTTDKRADKTTKRENDKCKFFFSVAIKSRECERKL